MLSQVGCQVKQSDFDQVDPTLQGSYSVALPDGRVQTVRYTADHYGGYVAEVTYEGTAVYPDAPAPYHAPAPIIVQPCQ